MLAFPPLRVLLPAILVAVLVSLPATSPAQAPDAGRGGPESEARDLLRVEAAVDRGLEYLSTKQDANGAWVSLPSWGAGTSPAAAPTRRRWGGRSTQ